jgi:hypothetical protein
VKLADESYGNDVAAASARSPERRSFSAPGSLRRCPAGGGMHSQNARLEVLVGRIRK